MYFRNFTFFLPGAPLPHHIGAWLSDIGLPQYEDVLEANGFDNLRFLVGGYTPRAHD